MANITNDEIQDQIIKASNQMTELRNKENNIRRIQDDLQKILFGPRESEKTPAVFEAQVDPEDNQETIQVQTSPAVMETVYDVAPKSLDDPTVELTEEMRAKRFATLSAEIVTITAQVANL